MKAITLHQPWASLIVDGLKKIETRSRPWYYNGPVAIHAGLKVDREACIRFGYDPDKIPTGAVLGTATKYDLIWFNPKDELKNVYTSDEYGDFTYGRWGYLLNSIKKFSEPIPARGHQGFWDWSPQ